jgi:hypothetical protein
VAPAGAVDAKSVGKNGVDGGAGFGANFTSTTTSCFPGASASGDEHAPQLEAIRFLEHGRFLRKSSKTRRYRGPQKHRKVQ